MKTIQESIALLHDSLREYIEATYHIGDPWLIEQRRALLNQPEVIHQVPYLESTPRYTPGEKYAAIDRIPSAATTVYELLSTDTAEAKAVLHNPPYSHQADAIRENLVNDRNLVIMTGTGSGKTESFLLPILGRIAREAQENPKSFAQPAVRAFLLYPMNALVNDQLGRLRGLFGDSRLVHQFTAWCGRPARFARYTSRTPYAGVRTKDKDSRKLKSFDAFYVDIERTANGPVSDRQAAAARIRSQLQSKGKWPAKNDLEAWFGNKGEPWYNKKTNEFLRAVTMSDDTELLTRHEVQAAPPDVLVTNYSMLEYMLLRPIERTIFERTKDWLEANPRERVTVVLDEAHLYRGAQGAEVGLLLRRLRERLGVDSSRVNVICATASFEDRNYAPEFGAQLSGAPASSFVPIVGTLLKREIDTAGSATDAKALAAVDLKAFYAAANDAQQKAVVSGLLTHLGGDVSLSLEPALYDGLSKFGPLGKLVNTTMGAARPVDGLGKDLFPDCDAATADAALTTLLALGSRARPDPQTAGLIPCRIHNFFRGLPGLWVCMDPQCCKIPEENRGGACGRMYAQPLERCGCGSRVLEFFTCRHCGAPYARAYTDNVADPSALWSMPGKSIRLFAVEAAELAPLDLLLVEPSGADGGEAAVYDLETGRLNAKEVGPHHREVYLRSDRLAPAVDEEGSPIAIAESQGQFLPCGVCGKRAAFNRSSVQDHLTKGDQPFQALLARQIEIQPPGPAGDTRFAPMRGRKVLVFSDSRQVAARLAPNLQMYSVRDALRSLLIWGFQRLQQQPQIAQYLNLDDAYFAVLLAAKALRVQLRPELKSGETFAAEAAVEAAVEAGALADPQLLYDVWMTYRGERAPEALLQEIFNAVTDQFLGLEALALASIRERPGRTAAIQALPTIPALAETPEAKLALARIWLRCWLQPGIWFTGSPGQWWGGKIRAHSGKFKAMERVLIDKHAKKIFNNQWLPSLNQYFAEGTDNARRLVARELSLDCGGAWVRCPTCKTVHRPLVGISACLDCDLGPVVDLDPNTDPSFAARKGYYRRGVAQVFADPPEAPMALIAAEHTAQLNAPQNDDAFSKAEANELLFQDVDMAWRPEDKREAAIDVLSSTTTMEVGIDIGQLSGVALRNMPPGRANYQQRAGRAGRRGNAVATVAAFGSADSHDEHYFSHPQEMIAGKVIDPHLTLNNPEIVKRHIRAYLLQRYHQEKLPEVDPEQAPELFAVLGSVANFKSGQGILNRVDFAQWLNLNASNLRERVAAWIPSDLDAEARQVLLQNMFDDCRAEIDKAIDYIPGESEPEALEIGGELPVDPAEIQAAEPADEDDGEHDPRSAMLLDRLLYRGVLPRYAFPTDVATFHVFDRNRSSGYRPIFAFAPSQGLPIALSQYAPGKQVWISGKCYTSGAIYSPMREERPDAWRKRKLYFECSVCHFAHAVTREGNKKREILDCPACGSKERFGPARQWMRPTGFAHPNLMDAETSPDNVPETSYATRAKLVMSTPGDDGDWLIANERFRGLRLRTFLLVSNTGPSQEGYSYCTSCGRIEATREQAPILGGAHDKPFPTRQGETQCAGGFTATKVVLGTDFITDIALFSMRVRAPLRLKPGWYSTDVALRTVSEALATAACQMLGIEPGELMAEYRPGLTEGGHAGLDAEIFLYDTLPGGAGFSSLLASRGLELFQRARDLLASCGGECDSSCYRCLRSFKNKFEHAQLDRHVGVELLDYLLRGAIPTFDAARIEKSTDRLFADLTRIGDARFAFQRNHREAVAGLGIVQIPILAIRHADNRRFAVALSGALTSNHPDSEQMQALAQHECGIKVIPINELLVKLNLPAATQETQLQLSKQ